MWDLFKSFSLANQIGTVGAFVGYAVGMGAVFVVSLVAGAIITGASVAFVIFCVWFFFGPEIRRRHLLERGEPAQATILAVRETGITVQGNYPMAKFRFEVHPTVGEPYEVWAKCLLNRFEIPAYQPGRTVSVLIDPKNRKKVVLA